MRITSLLCMTLLATSSRVSVGVAQNWKEIRIVGARNGVEVRWINSRSAVDAGVVTLEVYNRTLDRVRVKFTVSVRDKAGGSWPRKTFTTYLNPWQKKRFSIFNPRKASQTKGPCVVAMPRILIRNISREQRARAAAETQRRRTAETRRRAEAYRRGSPTATGA